MMQPWTFRVKADDDKEIKRKDKRKEKKIMVEKASGRKDRHMELQSFDQWKVQLLQILGLWCSWPNWDVSYEIKVLV